MKSPLEEYLRSEGIYYRFIPKSESIHTAEAASATGIGAPQDNKESRSRTGENDVVLIIPGDRRANLRRASEVLGERNVRLLSPMRL